MFKKILFISLFLPNLLLASGPASSVPLSDININLEQPTPHILILQEDKSFFSKPYNRILTAALVGSSALTLTYLIKKLNLKVDSPLSEFITKGIDIARGAISLTGIGILMAEIGNC